MSFKEYLGQVSQRAGGIGGSHFPGPQAIERLCHQSFDIIGSLDVYSVTQLVVLPFGLTSIRGGPQSLFFGPIAVPKAKVAVMHGIRFTPRIVRFYSFALHNQVTPIYNQERSSLIINQV